MGEVIKRVFDFSTSLMAIIILLPFVLIVAIFIKIDNPGPVFFSQIRIGKKFKPFKLYKFRTMIPDAEKKGLLITSGIDTRVTKVGSVLRQYKLDELPQLFNVLKGDISIVGPRPEVFKYVELFKRDYKEILSVKPGITDYATIEFRDEEGVLMKYKNPEDGYIKEVLPKKILLYKKYIKEKNFCTDMKLIFLTLWRIVKHDPMPNKK